MIDDTCANPNAEDAGANFLSISAKLGDLKIPELDEMDETVQHSELKLPKPVRSVRGR